MATALVTYTTRYRGGDDAFRRCAETKATELRQSGYEVTCRETHLKSDFANELAHYNQNLNELHFFGHSGLYGIMFGTTAWPEQFSPFEWQKMRSPFSKGAQAYFHACRTGVWFAPFMARTFNIRAHGYQLYTSLSASPNRFRLSKNRNAPLFMVSLPGKKSHGILGSASKYSGLSKVWPMDSYDPHVLSAEDTYNEVADAYDKAYRDIRVREDEWHWLEQRIPEGVSLCDIGCGTGALLRALVDRLKNGVGLDACQPMLDHAIRRGKNLPSLSFSQINGPTLPLDDQSVDIVTSLLSFRYLDWDPITQEIQRVLRPGGRLLIVDMVASPAQVPDFPRMLQDKLRVKLQKKRNSRFDQALNELVTLPTWQKMLTYNPMRAEHEYRWYLGSRFPAGTMTVLNVGLKSKILAFDSGPIETAKLKKQIFP